MDIKEIQELIKFVAKSGATEVNLEIDNVKISIKSPAKKGAVPETTIIQQIPVAQSPAAVMPTAAPAPLQPIAAAYVTAAVPTDRFLPVRCGGHRLTATLPRYRPRYC